LVLDSRVKPAHDDNVLRSLAFAPHNDRIIAELSVSASPSASSFADRATPTPAVTAVRHARSGGACAARIAARPEDAAKYPDRPAASRDLAPRSPSLPPRSPRAPTA